jgi:chain length determinant protein tyrosine kinase EpsG
MNMPSDLKTLDAVPAHGGTSLLQPALGRSEDSIVNERLIGALLDAKVALGAERVQQILEFARDKGVRFGEAAVAMGMVTQDQVLHALSEQFGYSYASEERRQLMPELVGLNQPFSMQAEAFREIRSQLNSRLFNTPVGQPRPALAVVSPSSGDGKTFFAANIAVSLAQVGGSTLLIDADLRGPRLHEVFKLDNKTGLSSVLAGHVSADVIQAVPDVANLFVMPVGIAPPNPLELIERPAFGALIRELTSKFDHVIVDTPAMMYGVDAQVVAARCGAALVVARRDQSRVAALQRLVAVLSQGTTRVAGVILNEH